MLSFVDLRPLQSMAAGLFFQHRRLMLSLPRQFGGKTELGVRLLHDLLGGDETRQAIFLAKDKKSAKRSVREKHMRIFDKADFKVNTELVHSKRNPSNACYIESVDKDPDRIRGGTYNFVHWSEVAFSRIEHGFTIKDVFDKVVQPTLELSDGYALLESTNNGLNGWHEIWNLADDFGFHKLLVSLSLMVQMGLVSRETYDRIKARTQPDVFRQEYECEWVTFAGRVYNEFDIGKHVSHDVSFPEDWQTVICGIDWGFEDATCILFAYVKDGITHVFDEIYMRKARLEEVMDAIQVHRVSWLGGEDRDLNPIAAVADHDPLRIEELVRRGIPCANAKKADVLGNRIQLKELMWKDRLIVHPRCPTLIKDLGACTWDPRKTNDIDYKQCTWGHFDAEAALRYLIRELSDLDEEKPLENPFQVEEDSLSHQAWNLRRERLADGAFAG